MFIPDLEDARLQELKMEEEWQAQESSREFERQQFRDMIDYYKNNAQFLDPDEDDFFL